MANSISSPCAALAGMAVSSPSSHCLLTLPSHGARQARPSGHDGAEQARSLNHGDMGRARPRAMARGVFGHGQRVPRETPSWLALARKHVNLHAGGAAGRKHAHNKIYLLIGSRVSGACHRIVRNAMDPWC